MSEPRFRQLLIGLDAMEWTLVERWAGEGRLPTFQRLLATGLRAPLVSFGDCLPDAVWTTLSYGVGPGKLEKYFYVQYVGATASLRYSPDTDLRGTPFWLHLARAGRRVGVVDVPHLPFHEIPNGFQLMNWGAHDTKGGAVTSPAPLLDEISARFGRYPVNDCERYNAGSKRALRDDILTGARTQGRLFRWLMQSRLSDVLFAVFSAPHCSGHHFWSEMDEGHPLHDPGDPDGLNDTLEQTYRAVDGEIGEMLALAGAGTRALVFAPHGMGPLAHASWNLNEILDLLGYGRSTDSPPVPGGARRGSVNPWRLVKMTVPARWQYAIKGALPRSLQDHLIFLWYAGGRRCGGRRVFAVPNNEIAGALRIGVRGRDHGGRVAPGAEYRQVCGEVTEALCELTDAATGRPVVRKVTPMHETFGGPFAEGLPDLVVLWDARFVWRALQSPRFGTLHLSRQDRRTGSHTPSSFVLACGPGIPAGARIDGSTLDIAPTVLRAAGVAVPDHLDGRPLPILADPA